VASWHGLRRTFATLADQEGISIGEREELMGHDRAEMTLHYSHVPSQQVSEVLERLPEKIVTAAHLKPAKKKSFQQKGRPGGKRSTESLPRTAVVLSGGEALLRGMTPLPPTRIRIQIRILSRESMDTSTTRQTMNRLLQIRPMTALLALLCGLIYVTACNRSKSKDEQLAALETAKQSGAVSQQEYDAKKAAIEGKPAPAATTAPASAPAPAPTPAPTPPTAGFTPPKVYIEPQPGGFESYITAGFIRKKTPVVVTKDRGEAAYILTAVVTQERESDAGKVARCAFASCAGVEGMQTATVQLTDQAGKVVWAYNVQKSGAASFQSSAEAIAKHLKEFLDPKPPKKAKKK